jgi:hypothetical protein
MMSASNEFETTILTGASLRVGIGSLFTCDSRLCCAAALMCCMLHVACCMLHVTCRTLPAAHCMLHVACCTLLVECCTAARRGLARALLRCAALLLAHATRCARRTANANGQRRIGCARDAGRNVPRAPCCSAQCARWDGATCTQGVLQAALDRVSGRRASAGSRVVHGYSRGTPRG